MTTVGAWLFKNNQHDFEGQSTCRFDAPPEPRPERSPRTRVGGGRFFLLCHSFDIHLHKDGVDIRHSTASDFPKCFIREI